MVYKHIFMHFDLLSFLSQLLNLKQLYVMLLWGFWGFFGYKMDIFMYFNMLYSHYIFLVEGGVWIGGFGKENEKPSFPLLVLFVVSHSLNLFFSYPLPATIFYFLFHFYFFSAQNEHFHIGITIPLNIA